jgi:hypothetical protein
MTDSENVYVAPETPKLATDDEADLIRYALGLERRMSWAFETLSQLLRRGGPVSRREVERVCKVLGMGELPRSTVEEMIPHQHKHKANRLLAG